MTTKTLPSPKTLYRALVDRDPTYDGLFIVGVKTTGIFCRPTCPARKPRPEHVEYFANAKDAETAGFRACLRCRPRGAPGTHPRWVNKLLSELQAAPQHRISDDELRQVGVEPTAARRYFREHFGMTFQAYQRTARLGLALNSIGRGRDLLAAGLETGFESSSGFREAFSRLFGQPPGRARGRAVIHATQLSTPIGAFIAAAVPSGPANPRGGVCLLEFADRPALLTQTATLRRWFDLPVVPGMDDVLEQLQSELGEYFAGTREEFEVPLAIAGTDFQKKVWERLRAIPYGQTRSYEEIATEVGRSGAQRAVGRANGDNRIAVVIPCHRVIRRDGTLCGYGGSLWRKRWLLAHERGAATEDHALPG